jgi:hypothetical protein
MTFHFQTPPLPPARKISIFGKLALLEAFFSDCQHNTFCFLSPRPSTIFNPSMTTIYIEEVTDDEVSSNIDDNDTDVTIHHPSKQSSFNSNLSPFRIEHLSPCPCPIGGGSSITSIGKKAFVFGGCDRTGVPSNGLHSYDFGAFWK